MLRVTSAGLRTPLELGTDQSLVQYPDSVMKLLWIMRAYCI